MHDQVMAAFIMVVWFTSTQCLSPLKCWVWCHNRGKM